MIKKPPGPRVRGPGGFFIMTQKLDHKAKLRYSGYTLTKQDSKGRYPLAGVPYKN
jgi:hypothetical protein